MVPRGEDDDPFALARRQSFGFFDDVHADHWRRLQRIFREHENHRYPARPLTFHPQARADQSVPEVYRYRGGHPGWHSIEAWYQNNYKPNFSCHFEKRVGEHTNGDGPKWVCDPHRLARLARKRWARDPRHPGCVVYSVGSNGDFNFELGLQREVGAGACEFHIFDPGDYAGEVPAALRRAHYHRWGIRKQGADARARPTTGDPGTLLGQTHRKAGDVDRYLGLRDTVAALGHEGLDAVDVFKIDCKKCELDTFRDWVADDVPRLQQLLVEVHEAPVDKVLPFFDVLEAAGYLRFHKEPNIQWNTKCLEYAFFQVDTAFMSGTRPG